jgi:hypothetical protein
MESLDIVKLIEQNPLTRLNNDYQSKLVNRLKYTFTDTQQRLFLGSFYCYLNYDSKKDFVINLDDVWKWCGFGRKEEAKRLIVKHFVCDIDYKISLRRIAERNRVDTDYKSTNTYRHRSPPNGGDTQNVGLDEKNGKRGGQNKETIMMTVYTFKKFCMKARTKKADEIHDYYVKMEEMLQDMMKEESVELRNQLQVKDKEIETKDKEIETKDEEYKKLEKNHKKLKMKKNYHKFNTELPGIYAVHNLLEGVLAPIKIGKYGTGDIHGLDERISTYRTNAPSTVIDFVFSTNTTKEATELESAVLTWYEDIRVHELINKPVEDIKDVLLRLSRVLDINVSIISDEDIDLFNKQPLENYKKVVPKSKFQCPKCEKCLSNKNCLKSHLTTHNNVNVEEIMDNMFPKTIVKTDFQCPMCDNYYSNRRSFRCHLVTVHKNEDIDIDKIMVNIFPKKIKKTRFRCSVCLKYLSSRTSLRQHVGTVHKIKNIDKVVESSIIHETDFQCEYCKSYYADKYKLNRHINNVHFKERQKIK